MKADRAQENRATYMKKGEAPADYLHLGFP